MKAFLCMRTGLYFPADYVERWGIDYGIGLGSVPVSEALTNEYWSKPQNQLDGQLMHSVANCLAPVQMVEVSETEYKAHEAILAKNDANHSQRRAVMLSRQIAHGKVADKNNVTSGHLN